MATKRQKKRQRREGRATDPNEVRRERIEARRHAKAEAMERQRRADRRAKLVRRALVILLLAGLVWFVLFRNQRPTEIAGRELSLFSESGGNPTHVDGTVSYPMTPPVSGQHSPSPMPCGTYSEQPPSEPMVHALEHGAIGLLYDSEKASIEDIRELEGVVEESESHVFSAPFAGMETTFSITSWGEMMRLDEIDRPAIDEYIDTFIQKGPEDIECPKDQAATFEPAPEPTPSPTPADGGNQGGNNGGDGGGGGNQDGNDGNGGGGGGNQGGNGGGGGS